MIAECVQVLAGTGGAVTVFNMLGFARNDRVSMGNCEAESLLEETARAVGKRHLLRHVYSKKVPDSKDINKDSPLPKNEESLPLFKGAGFLRAAKTTCLWNPVLISPGSSGLL